MAIDRVAVGRDDAAVVGPVRPNPVQQGASMGAGGDAISAGCRCLAVLSVALVLTLAPGAGASGADGGRPPSPTRDQLLAELMRPYAGPSLPGVDATTMRGKVLCGYQGWFAAEGDGL